MGGRHLRRGRTRVGVTRLGTRRSPFLRAGEYFIREEQRHARYLRDFLALEGFGTAKRRWADTNRGLEGCSRVSCTLFFGVRLPRRLRRAAVARSVACWRVPDDGPDL